MSTLLALALLAAAPPMWSYDVSPSNDLSELSVEASFTSASRLETDDPSTPFVHDVQRVDGEKTTPLKGNGGTWELPGCAKGCRVRYKFQLRAAASRLDNPDEVAEYGAIIESSPGAWLLRPPGDQPPDARYRLRVRSREGVRFATGLPSTGDLDTWEGPADRISMAPYSALGPIKVTTRSACAAEIQIAIAPGRRGVSDEELLEWATTGARQVCDYFGKLPVPSALILLVPGDRGFGKTLGGGGATTLLGIPSDADAEDLRKSWVLVHELVHTSLPSLAYRHHWMEEGLATYLEPIVRARAGALPPEEVWGDLVENLPKAELRAGEDGLDDAPRWGPTYWGGALFWLKLDLEIRRHTKGERSLREALRALNAQGGNISDSWPVEKVLAALDKGAGFAAAEPLYRALGTRRTRTNLEAMWKSLGVRSGDDGAEFDDAAPEAALRKAVTTRTPP
ncbi:MAG TPA: hypothetical protein VFA20_21315 [Myxococcaceae bacterium]|nr:hypothetical protein [Myxococcaceae bacterium]